MPANLGMIAFGKVKQLEKRIIDLEQRIEEAEKQIREQAPQPAPQQ